MDGRTENLPILQDFAPYAAQNAIKLLICPRQKKKTAKLPSLIRLHTAEPAYKRLQGNKDFKKSLLPEVIPHIKFHQNRMKIIEIQIFDIFERPQIFLKNPSKLKHQS